MSKTMETYAGDLTGLVPVPDGSVMVIGRRRGSEGRVYRVVVDHPPGSLGRGCGEPPDWPTPDCEVRLEAELEYCTRGRVLTGEERAQALNHADRYLTAMFTGHYRKP